MQLLDRSIRERVIDLVVDPRLPHALPRSVWRTIKYKNIDEVEKPLSQPLHVCLTFDVEHNFRDQSNTCSTERFIPKYLRWANDRSIRSTLYLQGDLLPKLSTLFKECLYRHELGLHGLHHEVWGRSRWSQYSLGYKSLTQIQKERHLMEALDRFHQADLPRPVAFRAPYLNTNRDTLRLLERQGFTSDSSVPTYYGKLASPVRHNKLWQIPVTVHPIPSLNWRTFWSTYMEFTVGNLLQMTPSTFLRVVRAALAVQEQAGWALPPFVVILGHPWEFESTPGVPYSSEDNLEKIGFYLDLLEKSYSVKYATISELVERHQ